MKVTWRRHEKRRNSAAKALKLKENGIWRGNENIISKAAQQHKSIWRHQCRQTARKRIMAIQHRRKWHPRQSAAAYHGVAAKKAGSWLAKHQSISNGGGMKTRSAA